MGDEQAATEAGRDLVLALHHRLQQVVAVHVAQVVRVDEQAGQLRADTDPEILARVLLLSFQGLLVLARSGEPDLSGTIAATFDALISS